MRLATALAAVLSSLSVLAATDMEHKAKVLRTLDTVLSGKAEILCDDPGPWTFDVRASVDAGRDVVTVRLTAPEDAVPPRFAVYFRVSGARVRNAWTSSSDAAQDGCHLWPKLWWSGKQSSSQLARDMPLIVGFDSTDRAPVSMACAEAARKLVFGLYADDETCDVIGRCEFFTEPGEKLRSYETSVLLDRRNRAFADVVRESTDWILARNGLSPAAVPEAAFDPLYSTWYAYLQDVHAAELEREAVLAASLGMKTMILDDGWQKMESKTFYSATGDWMPVRERFPDMKAHVAKVHAAGLKYMLWLSVPYIGDESAIWKRFSTKILRREGKDGEGAIAVLDPRFPDVREYLIRTYERVVGEWGFDGLKLDFIDQFSLGGRDPALDDGYAGRDYKSVPMAVDRLMRDVLARLRKINPDVLVEFRQRYMGPMILQYGNMIRATDCPADHTANRRRICGLRLTSGPLAVHSDMLVWSKDETPEDAAYPILNVLFSTIQYSMILARVSDAHREVIRHWLDFTARHRKTLLKGAFRPHHPEAGYPWVEAESAEERIIAAYSPELLLPTGAADRPVLLVNATGAAGLAVEASAAGEAELFDVVGRPVGKAVVPKGLSRLAVPQSGYAVIRWN